jgi:alpha-D-ribose 1-methylphosphonate 5-triphosphate synthase subunit PhnL
MAQSPRIQIEALEKTFVLHAQSGAAIPVFAQLSLDVRPGECVALAGQSGVGKSTLIRTIYGNYRPTKGSVRVLHDGAMIDITQAAPSQVRDIRRRSLGYVSQFLRVIPRISTRDLVMAPLLENGTAPGSAREAAETMLAALNLPRAHWDLPPATFSGGEQQRVNLARSFVRNYPILLLDEPTASLDPENRAIVIGLVRAALANGAAMIGIFHDRDVRDQIATRNFEVADFRVAA